MGFDPLSQPRLERKVGFHLLAHRRDLRTVGFWQGRRGTGGLLVPMNAVQGHHGASWGLPDSLGLASPE